MPQVDEHPAAPPAPAETDPVADAAPREAAALVDAPPSTSESAMLTGTAVTDRLEAPAPAPSAPAEKEARATPTPPPAATPPPAPAASEPTGGKNELLSDNDLMSALASLEALPKAEIEKIPSLSADEPAAKTGGGKRFKIPPKGAAGAEAPAPAGAVADAGGTPNAPAETAASGPIVIPKLGIGKRVYRALDWVLATINRPFSFLPAGLRMIIGGFALTTIAVNGAWMVLQPMLFPPRDAVTYLQERRALLDHPPETADAGHGESDDGHDKAAKDDHGAKPAKDDHGKKPAKDDHGKKPAKDDHGTKTEKTKEHAKKDDHGKPEKKSAKADKKKKAAEKSSGHH